MGALTDILKTHLIAYERVDGTGERIDNIASAEAAINQYISEIIGEDEEPRLVSDVGDDYYGCKNCGWSHLTDEGNCYCVTRNKLRAEQRARAGITAKGDNND